MFTGRRLPVQRQQSVVGSNPAHGVVALYSLQKRHCPGGRSVAAFLYLLAVIHGPCVHVRWDYAGVL